MTTKQCTKCQHELPLLDFEESSKHRDGVQSRCKECCGRSPADYLLKSISPKNWILTQGEDMDNENTAPEIKQPRKAHKGLTGPEIRQFREANEMSQEALASKLGVYWTTVSRWENGHFSPSSLAEKVLRNLMSTYEG